MKVEQDESAPTDSSDEDAHNLNQEHHVSAGRLPRATGLRCLRGDDSLVPGQVPQERRAVIAAGCQYVAVWRDGEGSHSPMMPHESLAFPTHGQVPDRYEMVVSCRGQRLAAGQEGERSNPRRFFIKLYLPTEFTNEYPSLQRPDPGHTVNVSRCQRAAVRRKRNGHGSIRMG